MQETVPIKPNVMAEELTCQLAETGAELLSRCMSDLEHSLNACVEQPTEGVTLGKLSNQIKPIYVCS